MGGEAWRHLVWWELRQAVSRAPYRLMLLVAAVLPPAVAAIHARYADTREWDLAWLVGAQVLTLSALVAAWTLLAVKRLVAREVSDDWLLVVGWRQSLAARYVAGAVLGCGLFAASVAGATAVWAWESFGWEGLDFYATQVIVGLSLLQPLATATLMVGAVDFLLAAPSLVLAALLFATLVWSAVPGGGFYWLAVLVSTGEYGEPDTPWRLLWLAVPACVLLACYGWARCEDFWQLLEGKRRPKGSDSSVGEIRGALDSAQTPRRAADRAALACARSAWAWLGCEPLLAHDLARFPWLSLTGARTRLVLLFPLVALATAVGLWCALSLMVEQSYHQLAFFAAWAIGAVTVLRALASGVQIIFEEREQGGLEALFLTPISPLRLVSAKTTVVLAQALPSLVVMYVLFAAGGLDTEALAPFIEAALVAAVGGVTAACLVGNRLSALLGGAALAAALVPLLGRVVESHGHPVVMLALWLATCNVPLWLGARRLARETARRRG